MSQPVTNLKTDRDWRGLLARLALMSVSIVVSIGIGEILLTVLAPVPDPFEHIKTFPLRLTSAMRRVLHEGPPVVEDHDRPCGFTSGRPFSCGVRLGRSRLTVPSTTSTGDPVFGESGSRSKAAVAVPLVKPALCH